MSWIFIRGLIREQAHWGQFLDSFQKIVQPKQIVLVDSPGCGVYYQERSPTKLEEYTDHLRNQWLEKHTPKNEEKFGVVAISMGAMIAMNWMIRFPQDFAQSVLINTSIAGKHPFYKRFQPKGYVSVAKIVRHWNADLREDLIYDLTSNIPANKRKTVDWWNSIRKKRPVSLANAARQIFAAAHYQPSKQVPPIPVLLLTGKKDRVAHPSCSEQLSQQWNCAWEQNGWGGHDLPLDAPDWVAETIARWKPTSS